MKKILGFALAGLLCSCIQLQAQCNYKITGRVTDKADGNPLEFVAIYIVELQTGAMSDSTGSYTVEKVCKGNYTVRLSHIGCEPVENKITVAGNTTINFTLPHSANLLESIDITSYKEPEKLALMPELSGAALDKTRGSTLAGSLSSLPGVTTLKTGSTIEKPVIHGLYGNRVLIFNNGVRLESQQWGSEHAPEVDPFTATKLTVITGAGSVRYGSDAIAGVILADPAPMRDSSGTGGQLDLVGFTNGRGGAVSAMAEHRFKQLMPLAVRLQGTFKRSGNITTPDYYLKNTGMKEYDFSWAATWTKKTYGLELWYSQFNTDLAIFSASHIGNLTDFDNAIHSDVPLETSGFSYKIARPYQHSEHEFFRAGGHINTGKSSKINFSYSRQYDLRQEYDKDLPLNDSLAALNLPELSFEITSHIADAVWDHQDGSAFSGQAGISGQWQGNTFEGRFFIPSFIARTGALFATERWSGENTSVEAGIRYEVRDVDVYINTGEEIRNDSYNYSGLSGTLGGSHRFNEQWELLLNLSTAWRAPTVNELYADGLHHGAAAVEKGDITLKEESAINSSIGLTFKPKAVSEIGLSLYSSFFSGFIYLQPELPPSVIIQGTFPTFFYRQGDARLFGCDLHATTKLSQHVFVNGKASILYARNTETDDYLPGIPPGRAEGGMEYHFKDVYGWSNLKAGFTASYIGKQTRVPSEADYAPPPPDYLLGALEAGGLLKINKQTVSVSLSVENIFNTAYRDYMNRYRYFADEAGRNVVVRLKIPINGQ